MVFEDVSGAVGNPDLGGHCAVKVGDRDRSVEDAGGVIVRVCFPSALNRFVGLSGDGGSGPTFSSMLLNVGERPEWFQEEFAGIGAVRMVPEHN